MAVRVPAIYKNMYLGDMTDRQAEIILKVQKMKVVENLKNTIFNFDIELINKAFEEGISIRKILLRDKIDYRKYIGELRDYQTVGTAFMYVSPRSILGDGVGIGKTAETASLINYLYYKKELTRFLIAVENSAVGQTQYELMKFTGLNVLSLPSEKNKMERAIRNYDWNEVDGVVIKHSSLKSDAFSRFIARNIKPDGSFTLFNTFILDESSVIKNRDTKVFEYTENLCNLVPRVHFLNATTFETSIMDIYNQMDIINPNLLPSKSRIEKNYCVYSFGSFWRKENGKPVRKKMREFKEYKNQEQFKESLKLVYMGRCKKDVGLDIQHVYKVFEVLPTADQMLAIGAGHRYAEVLNCPSLIPEINIQNTRKSVPKLDRLISLIENDFRDSRIMVYCFHKQAQQAIKDELAKIGKSSEILNGDVESDSEKYDIQNRFNCGETDVIITNAKKSLNLHGGDVCIFYSTETNPAKAEQIRGRIDRNISKDIKTFVMLLYKHTDEYNFFMNVVTRRAKDARDLTIDAETAVDLFVKSM